MSNIDFDDLLTLAALGAFGVMIFVWAGSLAGAF